VVECGPCPVFASFTLAFVLQLRKKHGKTTVRVRKTSVRLRKTSVTVQYTYYQTHPHMNVFFWVIPRPLNFICRRFGTLGLFHLHRQAGKFIYLLAYEDGTECSETSAYKIQPPGNYPEENIQHTEHGESLKSRTPTHYKALINTNIYIQGVPGGICQTLGECSTDITQNTYIQS
jgi:hypothetical protein